MENKDKMAFPFYEPGTGFGSVSEGLSKLEFFACNAPADIPGWFKHITPDFAFSEMHNPDEIENEEDRKEVKGWLRDPIFDLPDHLKWFSDRVELVRQEKKVFEAKNTEARYFQWRRYYAEQLLVELSKPQP
jgi:hypothetical protein